MIICIDGRTHFDTIRRYGPWYSCDGKCTHQKIQQDIFTKLCYMTGYDQIGLIKDPFKHSTVYLADLSDLLEKMFGH